MSAQVHARLTELLAIEEVLGAAAIDGSGCVESCINLSERDAAALYQVLSSAVGTFSTTNGGDDWHERAPSFATFALRDGQIAFSGTRRRALIVVTDPDIGVRLLKGLLHEVLTDLALLDHQSAAPTDPTPVPVG